MLHPEWAIPHLAWDSGEAWDGSCSGIIIRIFCCWHDNLKLPRYTAWCWNMLMRNNGLCTEPAIETQDAFFGRNCCLHISTKEGSAWRHTQGMPLRETFLRQSLTMSFLTGYSTLKVWASIPAWFIEGKKATSIEIKYNYGVSQQNGQVNPDASAYHVSILKRN